MTRKVERPSIESFNRVQMHTIDALMLCLLPIAIAVPAFFYFRALSVNLDFILFTAGIAIPLCVSLYLLLRIPTYNSVNKYYGWILVFYVIGSIYQVHEVGIRALDLIAFKEGLSIYKDGSEFKIPILAGLLGWSKLLLIFTNTNTRYLKIVAISSIILFEVIINFKRSALIFVVIPLVIALYRSRSRRVALVLFVFIVGIVFGVIGDFRESGVDVFFNLHPLSDFSTINWLLSYTSINYHVAYQKYLAGGEFDWCNLTRIFTNESTCTSDFSIYGFNAGTYVGPFVEAGIFGILLLQLMVVGLTYTLSRVSSISVGLYLYINTLWLLNLFGAYWLERNEGLLLIVWIIYELRNHITMAKRTSHSDLIPKP
jgi:hypothetical protein